MKIIWEDNGDYGYAESYRYFQSDRGHEVSDDLIRAYDAAKANLEIAQEALDAAYRKAVTAHNAEVAAKIAAERRANWQRKYVPVPVQWIPDPNIAEGTFLMLPEKSVWDKI